MTVPTITIFVRHAAACKHAGDEFSKRCNCRKHLRWTAKGEQLRKSAGTRSWAEAEVIKRDLQDQLSGRAVVPDKSCALRDAVSIFIKDKTVEGVSAGVIKKYTLELARLVTFCEDNMAYTVEGISRELLTKFCVTWPSFYPSSCTRAKVRERCCSFLKYCYEAGWIPRIPNMPKIKIDEAPTMPLTDEEYKRILDATFATNPRRWDGKKSTRGMTEQTGKRIRALFQLMRWSGLAIRDAVTLSRAEIVHDVSKDMYRVVTSRQKTGTHVSVPIPKAVALEVLAVENTNPKYVFWTGDGPGETIAKTWANRYIRPVFEAANIPCGHMVSHRLRDTFAVHLLETGTPMEEVSRMLGHTSIRTTERSYAKWSKSRQDRADSFVAQSWQAVKMTPAPRKKAAGVVA